MPFSTLAERDAQADQMVSSEDRNTVGSKIGNTCQTGSGADFAAHCSQPPAVAVWYCSRIHRVRPSEFEAMDPAGRFEQSHRRVPDRAHANRGKILPLSTSLANQDKDEQCTIRLAAFPAWLNLCRPRMKDRHRSISRKHPHE